MAKEENSGLHLYTDNFYTSPCPVLYNHLYINACGTCRPGRRGFPKRLFTTYDKVNRGKYNFRSNGPVLCTNWNDKKVVYFVSTMHRARPLPGHTCTVPRQDGSTSSPCPCPPLLPDYTAFMRGVDRVDQLVSYHNIGRRSYKWWRRVFFYLLEVCILNALVLDLYFRPASMLCVRSGMRCHSALK